MPLARAFFSRFAGVFIFFGRYFPAVEVQTSQCRAERRIWFGRKGLNNARSRLLFCHGKASPRRRYPQDASISEPAGSHHATAYHSPACFAGQKGDLPVVCSGCGALTHQTPAPDLAGHFSLERKSVRRYLGLEDFETPRLKEEDLIVQNTLQSIDAKTSCLKVDLSSLIPETPPSFITEQRRPLCDRCHQLTHHNSAAPIFHPSVQSIRETINQSPHKYNHVYHVIDAADFPMSMLRIDEILDSNPLRTQNRRSKPKFHHGKQIDLSFIVTRADLLAPRKEQVDSLMPYLRETLRAALGRKCRNVRLGNLRCVSAKSNWWTKELKEDIWRRGGAGWMVGKVNVGKSQLFEAVFPKGRMKPKLVKRDISVCVFPRQEEASYEEPRQEEASEHQKRPDTSSPQEADVQEANQQEHSAETSELQDTWTELSQQAQYTCQEREKAKYTSLELPPAQEEQNYPDMPVVSSLPGTTAAPIRVPFGSGRGELIDMPGLSRGDLERYVVPEERKSLVMRSRVTPEQQVIKPGQSIVIGGLIRITPRTPDFVFLSYAFTPLHSHLTETSKAIDIQEQRPNAPHVETVALKGAGTAMKHAGSFELCYDVTKRRAGPITSRTAVHIAVERLPYRVVAIDLLIEGCGWVEIAAQVRTKYLFAASPRPSQNPDEEEFGRLLVPRKEEKQADGPHWPVVDVFSPEGRFIGSRPPMNAWLLNKPKREKGRRPRRSMKGVKKEIKRARRGWQGGGLRA